MLNCIKFILQFVIDLCSMLFNIMVDNNLSFGLLVCIIFIFLPIVHRVICFIKQDAMDELDDAYDMRSPRENFRGEFHESVPFRNGTLSYTHSFTKSRRRRR